MIEDALPKKLGRLLVKVDILEPLPPEEVERVALLSSSMRLEVREAVALGDDRKTLLLLVSGRVRVASRALGDRTSPSPWLRMVPS